MDEIFEELYIIVRKKNAELLLYGKQSSRYLLECLGSNVMHNTKILNKDFKKNKDITNMSIQLLHDTLLLGLILENKEERKSIYTQVEFCDVHESMHMQTRSIVNRVKRFISWMSIYNYVCVTEKVIGLLVKVSIDFTQLIPLIQEAKGYEIKDFYRKVE